MNSEKLHQKVWEVCTECGIKDFPFDCIAVLKHYDGVLQNSFCPPELFNYFGQKLYQA